MSAATANALAADDLDVYDVSRENLVAAALKCTAQMLADGGLIYVTQTFQNRPSPIAERVKPLLQRFTSVDFGRVTYFTEVAEIARKAGMTILEDGKVPGSIDNPSQTARLIVLKPAKSQ